MANKRMISLDIVETDAFIDMPISARLLYFDLVVRADDDGFLNNARSIARLSGCTEKDLEKLAEKKFVLLFDSGIVVIKHWLIHNTIRLDRYVETKWKDEKSLLLIDENRSYSFNSGVPLTEYKKIRKPLTEAQSKRLEAKKESDLPSSFDQRIKNAFNTMPCPICGVKMNYEIRNQSPTINHNLPIALGGKHELSNISVICHQCNSSIGMREIGRLNNDLVVEKWNEINQEKTGMATNVGGNGNAGLDLDLDLDLVKNKTIEQIETPKNATSLPLVDALENDAIEKAERYNAKYFDEFWKHYPLKVGKQKCINWFKSHKVGQLLLDKMIEALSNQKQNDQWQRDGGRFIPHPYTWLNQGRWDDEAEIDLSVKPTDEQIAEQELVKQEFIQARANEKVSLLERRLAEAEPNSPFAYSLELQIKVAKGELTQARADELLEHHGEPTKIDFTAITKGIKKI